MYNHLPVVVSTPIFFRKVTIFRKITWMLCDRSKRLLIKYEAAKSCRDLCWKETYGQRSQTLMISTPVLCNNPSWKIPGDFSSKSSCRETEKNKIHKFITQVHTCSLVRRLPLKLMGHHLLNGSN